MWKLPSPISTGSDLPARPGKKLVTGVRPVGLDNPPPEEGPGSSPEGLEPDTGAGKLGFPFGGLDADPPELNDPINASQAAFRAAFTLSLIMLMPFSRSCSAFSPPVPLVPPVVPPVPLVSPPVPPVSPPVPPPVGESQGEPSSFLQTLGRVCAMEGSTIGTFALL